MKKIIAILLGLLIIPLVTAIYPTEEMVCCKITPVVAPEHIEKATRYE